MAQDPIVVVSQRFVSLPFRNQLQVFLSFLTLTKDPQMSTQS